MKPLTNCVVCWKNGITLAFDTDLNKWKVKIIFAASMGSHKRTLLMWGCLICSIIFVKWTFNKQQSSPYTTCWSHNEKGFQLGRGTLFFSGSLLLFITECLNKIQWWSRGRGVKENAGVQRIIFKIHTIHTDLNIHNCRSCQESQWIRLVGTFLNT